MTTGRMYMFLNFSGIEKSYKFISNVTVLMLPLSICVRALTVTVLR